MSLSRVPVFHLFEASSCPACGVRFMPASAATIPLALRCGLRTFDVEQRRDKPLYPSSCFSLQVTIYIFEMGNDVRRPGSSG